MAIQPIVADVIRADRASAVRLHGLLGRRLDLMRRNRLRGQEAHYLLWPFLEGLPADPDRRNAASAPHPDITSGDWHGEFMGTWVATATAVAENADDQMLRAKLDGMVDDWLSAQREDGYLGTYVARDRWQSWDVWIQAHDLIGLIVYYETTGRGFALEAAVRVADRVLADFGPGRRSLRETGPSEGLASSAILEPIVWLFRLTGEERFLRFARWLVDVDWEAPGGPAIVSSMLRGADVSTIGTGKAAEMLISFAGLLELYRSTNEGHYLAAVRTAWDSIAADHLYITGTASTSESFQRGRHLPNDGPYRVGETCVTMTWLYLTLGLGRLTGEAKYFDAVEQTAYNHLLGAQSPDGQGWAYYVGLRDSKRYGRHTDPECCPTRGSRALSLMPQAVLGLDARGVVVNLYEACTGELTLDDGTRVGIRLEGSYPAEGDVTVSITLDEPASFQVRLRKPSWCHSWTVGVNGSPEGGTVSGGYACIDRTWLPGDVIHLAMDMPASFVVDRLGNNGRVAVVRGPLVFAADRDHLPGGRTLDDVTLDVTADGDGTPTAIAPAEDPAGVRLKVAVVSVEHDDQRRPWPGQRYQMLDAEARATTDTIELVPFFEAGNRDPRCYDPGVRDRREPVLSVTYQVWLPYRDRPRGGAG